MKKTPARSSNKPERAQIQIKLSKFAEKVYAVVAKIPKGKTMTYKQVAAKAGKPFAARAVGSLMAKNYRPGVPCHRVIRSDGRIGNYNRGGQSRKTELLREEGFLK
jgi:methylated-DNA-[protein]-cysteine S-methyltransferase